MAAGRRVRPLVAGSLAVVAIAMALLWWNGRAAGFVVAPDSDRNVLLITIDTLRADAMSTYGGRAPAHRISTPSPRVAHDSRSRTRMRS